MGAARMARTITDAVSADNIAKYMLSFSDGSNACYSPDNNFKTVRHVAAWIRNINKQITQTANHLEKLVYQSFPELLVYCRHGFPNWLLNLLQRYSLPSDIIKAGKSRLAKLDFITEEKAGAIISKARNTVAGQGRDELLSATIKSMVTLLYCNRQQIELQKKALVNQFKEAHEVQLLDSIPGIAAESAILLMMDIENIDNYKGAKQLCAHFGIHPTFKQSGDGTWASRLSKVGRSSVRGLLYMPALTAIRSNEYFKNLYAIQRAKGKKHKQAICVVMHKMLCIAFGILKSKKPFDIETHQLNQKKGEQKQKEAIEKQKQNNKEKKTQRERYVGENQLEAPISGKQSKRIKKELLVPIGNNQNTRDPEALNKDKQITCLSS
jgi:hypothetical protein